MLTFVERLCGCAPSRVTGAVASHSLHQRPAKLNESHLQRDLVPTEKRRHDELSNPYRGTPPARPSLPEIEGRDQAVPEGIKPRSGLQGFQGGRKVPPALFN